MHAVIIATGHNPDLAPLTDWYPASLLSVVDRPFIQHVVENLIDQGVTDFDFVLSHLPEKIEALLGDGQRWGSTFTYHLARDAEHPYQALKHLPTPEAPILLAHADRLPACTIPTDTQASVIFTHASEPDDDRTWTGWALLTPADYAALPGDTDESGLADVLMRIETAQSTEVPHLLSARSFDLLLSSNRQVLSGDFPVRLLTGTQVDEGIWVSRNVNLHPTAQLNPPLFIGENSRIGPGVQLGPNTVIAGDCILDSGCRAENTLVFQGSYVGESLELDEVIVDRNRLINVRVGAAVSIADDFILGSLADGQMRHWTRKKLSQAGAVVLLCLMWPIMLLTAFLLKLMRKGPVLYKTEVVVLPATPQPWEWRTFELWSFSDKSPTIYLSHPRLFRGLRHFLLFFLPALVNIARGQLRFVGVPPRTRDQVEQLSADWQSLYLESEAGLITETDIQYFGTAPTDDEQYSAEAFYTVTTDTGYNLKLIWKYLGRVLNPFC